MFIHDIIKIKYSKEGYLPDYPYHLISDGEMFAAFLNEDDSCFLYDTYPCPDELFREEYDALIAYIKKKIDAYHSVTPLPDWIYSYMLGVPIYMHSSIEDRHDLLVSMNLDNLNDEIGVRECAQILKFSKEQLLRIPDIDDPRPPTIFGEPHVLKYLRLLKLSGQVV